MFVDGEAGGEVAAEDVIFARLVNCVGVCDLNVITKGEGVDYDPVVFSRGGEVEDEFIPEVEDHRQCFGGGLVYRVNEAVDVGVVDFKVVAVAEGGVVVSICMAK